MKSETLQKLKTPGDDLNPLTLDSGDFNNGVLKGGKDEFPIIDGIPRFLDKRFDKYTHRSFVPNVKN